MSSVLIGALTDLPDGRGVRVEVAGRRPALSPTGPAVSARGARCTPAEASPAEGDLVAGEVKCPRHGSTFDLRTGKPGSLPATKPVPVYTVRVTDGAVHLELEDT